MNTPRLLSSLPGILLLATLRHGYAGEHEPMPVSAIPLYKELTTYLDGNPPEAKDFEKLLQKVVDRIDRHASVYGCMIDTLMSAATKIDYHNTFNAEEQPPPPSYVAILVDAMVPKLKRQFYVTSQPLMIAGFLRDKANRLMKDPVDTKESQSLMQEAVRTLAPHRNNVEILRLVLLDQVAHNAGSLKDFDTADENYRILANYPWDTLDGPDAKNHARFLVLTAANHWIDMYWNNPERLDALSFPPDIAAAVDDNLQSRRKTAGLPHNVKPQTKSLIDIYFEQLNRPPKSRVPTFSEFAHELLKSEQTAPSPETPRPAQ